MKYKLNLTKLQIVIPFLLRTGDGSKFPGGPSKRISGGSTILNDAFQGGKNMLTNIFQWLSQLHKDFQGGCRNHLLSASMLFIISKGIINSNYCF